MKTFEFYRFSSLPESCRRTRQALLLALGLLYLPICIANEHASQIHGFISQGYTYTSANNFHGDSQNNGSFDFREVGVNSSYRFNQRSFVSGQILSNKAGSSSNGDLSVDFLLLDYRLVTTNHTRTGIQIGRVKNPFGFYNETRDVPFTRPSIILPQSIYFDRTRDLTLSSDGLHVYSSLDLPSSVLRAQLQAARPRINSEKLENILFKTDTSNEFEAALSYIVKITWEQEGRGLNLALSLAQLNSDYISSGGNGMLRFSPRIFSLQYNTLNWSITGEYARRPFYFDNIPLLPEKQDGESYYLQATWRFTSRLCAVVRRDIAYLDRDDKAGSKREALTGGLTPAYSMFAKDWSLGARYTINTFWEVALENHWVHGTAWLPTEDNPPGQSTKEYWRLLTAQVSFQF